MFGANINPDTIVICESTSTYKGYMENAITIQKSYIARNSTLVI